MNNLYENIVFPQLDLLHSRGGNITIFQYQSSGCSARSNFSLVRHYYFQEPPEDVGEKKICHWQLWYLHRSIFFGENRTVADLLTRKKKTQRAIRIMYLRRVKTQIKLFYSAFCAGFAFRSFRQWFFTDWLAQPKSRQYRFDVGHLFSREGKTEIYTYTEMRRKKPPS